MWRVESAASRQNLRDVASLRRGDVDAHRKCRLNDVIKQYKGTRATLGPLTSDGLDSTRTSEGRCNRVDVALGHTHTHTHSFSLSWSAPFGFSLSVFVKLACDVLGHTSAVCKISEELTGSPESRWPL